MLGVELFVKQDDVFFGEVSPRPHDTGLATIVSPDLIARSFIFSPTLPMAHSMSHRCVARSVGEHSYSFPRLPKTVGSAAAGSTSFGILQTHCTSSSEAIFVS